ncbi:amidohydrolase [Mycobacterium saskatchewanense]|uniref:Amidohydrolase n=1 Tax=Mycobacterium saskatchewanense TaxID=220927 RepID=A0AAJ3NMJ6_9MYCO|nr:amidohydrolase family protein [Mycobacterium saskatchewanense]ORW69050.1 amidohydrolase [Mycobacterium saskatchewanense]BBX61703.1 amidohydrolase [Mycobacterium saskatchewanense]
MRTVGLEEHFVTAAVVEAWGRLEPQWQNPPEPVGGDDLQRRLGDLHGERFAAMDDTGLDVQVLSLTSPGVQNVPAGDAVALQTASNDLVADAVRAHPDRLQGFATLAATDPGAAARELERAVTTLGLNGAMIFPRSRGRALDHRDFWPIFETAATLGAPLYLHPQVPPAPVQDVYYGGFDAAVNAGFATYGIGWHYEVGVALIRLILAGVFDQFPDLQVIAGHWGEVVLFYLERVDNLAAAASLKQPVSEYFRSNVFVTPSGIFSQRYLRWALEVMGPDRILFSTDYPYRFVPDGGARRFLQDADLSEADREKVASGNWERICAAIRR